MTTCVKINVITKDRAMNSARLLVDMVSNGLMFRCSGRCDLILLS